MNRDGIVCAVVFTGPNRGAEWPGSSLISAEKANTANAFSTDNFALSSATYSPRRHRAIPFTASSPVRTQTLRLQGDPQKFGQADDPLVGKPIGGVIVFGGGLALYDKSGHIVGALGVSGDTSCADHVVAWKTRHSLGLDNVPMGVAPGPSDNLIFDIQQDASSSGFGHPTCKGGEPSEEIIKKLTDTLPSGPHR